MLRSRWVILVALSLGLGMLGTIWGMSNEFYVDPSSGVRMRGCPVASLKYPPFWDLPRKWRIHVIGFLVDLILWSVLPFCLGLLLFRPGESKRGQNRNGDGESARKQPED